MSIFDWFLSVVGSVIFLYWFWARSCRKSFEAGAKAAIAELNAQIIENNRKQITGCTVHPPEDHSAMRQLFHEQPPRNP